MADRYWIRVEDLHGRYVPYPPSDPAASHVGPAWWEVSKEVWVLMERLVGFNNTMNQPDEPATGGFGGSYMDLWIQGSMNRHLRDVA